MKAPLKQTIIGKTVVVFDSECLLCSRFIRFMIRVDRKEQLLFTDSKSSYFDFLLKTQKIETPIETIYVLINGKVFKKSEAVLQIFASSVWWGKCTFLIKVLPLTWRDKLYDWVAKNRYQWFGKTDVCLMDELPTNRKRRFIE